MILFIAEEFGEETMNDRSYFKDDFIRMNDVV
jgi:hypothetical protein